MAPVVKPAAIRAPLRPRARSRRWPSLNAVVSKLRAALRKTGIPAPHGVATESGTFQLTLPDAWFDIEDARTSIDAAEGALRRHDLGGAWAAANVSAVIARQSFLVRKSRRRRRRPQEKIHDAFCSP